MSELINYYPDLIQRKIGVRESFESKCTRELIEDKITRPNFLSNEFFNFTKTFSFDNFTAIYNFCPVRINKIN
jgi:hypothetical protein